MGVARSVVIRLFATAREAVGSASVPWELGAPAMSVEAVLHELSARHPNLGRLLPSCRIFVNGRLVPRPGRRAARAGDDIAVHPPYSGG